LVCSYTIGAKRYKMATPRKRPEDIKPSGRPIEWTEEKVELLRQNLEEFSKQPSFIAMAQWHADSNTYRDLLPDFRERCPKFRDTEKLARARAEANLLRMAAGGACPPAFGIFALKNYGWSDRQEVDVTSKGERIGAAALNIYGDTPSNT
jgi:hypothetical protein